MVQNETHRTEMKDAARRAFGGAISDACDFSRGLTRPGWKREIEKPIRSLYTQRKGCLMEHVIMMHAKDNIAIVMAPSLAVGSEFTVGGKMVCAKDELPFAHKVAIKAIPKGGQIVKYGEPVGIATADIDTLDQ